jgi:hypothetical protein
MIPSSARPRTASRTSNRSAGYNLLGLDLVAQRVAGAILEDDGLP